MWDWQPLLWNFEKLLIAALIGGCIGFERESHGQAAGLRTNILVCIGSCLMMILSLHMEELYRHLMEHNSVVRLDPARIASYAIASMGFLGAGAIITGRGSVRGLTTAAGLWLVTGLGLTIGAGYLMPAIFCTIISLVVLFGFMHIKSLLPRDEHTMLTLKFARRGNPLEQIKQIMAEHQILINFVNYKAEPPNDMVTYRLRLQSKEDLPWGQIVKRLSELKWLQEIHWEEGEVP
ncbi:MAG: MgtC/SapB family protein [Deltaproteobacteria bacterium]|nr:MgtC/SapB family protein [Deltaproteobacteria bacterium]MBW1952897.1 MgtC/SapB family protein [Deltaproteobacteria bacterium]MBW1987131.1 MgtC/SapB family protein [Deltaproteobacteria bacterium]MBW2135343.1 MgtC/SapB family protein [Deltaproteobacteria bacterium]